VRIDLFAVPSLDVAWPWLLDGAMGTELIARGLVVRRDCPEAWNVERPDEVAAIHRAYAQAGARAVQTNTFGATRPRLARFGREGQTRELCLAAVALAKASAPGCVTIGSLGPSGETLPLGNPGDLRWLEAAYAEAAAALAEGGAQVVHLETMFHPAELAAAVRGAREGAPGLPVWASMTLMAGVTGLETPHGVPIQNMVRAVETSEPDAVGVNCTLDAERMYNAVAALRSALPLPVVARPQAKISEKCASGRSSETPEAFAGYAVALFDAGAAAVGGCCGVGPAGIAALAAALARRATVAHAPGVTA
jgi:methionine synthase I (cobalamin-dependent)